MERGGKGLFTLSSLCVLPVTFLCFSALVLRDRALQTIKWFKWLRRVSLETINHKIPVGIHTGPPEYLCFSAILKPPTRCPDLDPLTALRWDRAQHKQQWAMEVTVPLDKEHCPCPEHLREEHPAQSHPQGHGSIWNVPCWVPGGWLKIRSRIPSPNPKIRGRGRQPSWLIPVRNHCTGMTEDKTGKLGDERSSGCANEQPDLSH